MDASSPSRLVQRREQVAGLLFFVLVFALAYAMFRIFIPFLEPLAWAAVLVVFFYPLHRRLQSRLGRPVGAALLSTFLVTVILIVPTFFLASAFVREGVQAAHSLQEKIEGGRFGAPEHWREWIVRHAPIRLEQTEGLVREQTERIARWLASQAAAIARNVAAFLFQFVVTLLAMFYFFRDGPRVVERLRGLVPLEAEHRDFLLRRIRELIQVTIRSSFVVAGLQGVIGGLLFWAVGIPSPVFWGVIMSFLGLFPLIGPWLIWMPAGVVLLAEGRTVRGVAVLAVGVGVISMVDNILRPALIGTSARLSGLLIFISVLGGIAAFGMLGLVLGPILVVCAVSLMETYAERLPPR